VVEVLDLFVEQYLHAPAATVNEQALSEFISQGIEEGQTLDYKGKGAFGRDPLMATVCAMANSTGGLIVLGVGSKPDAHAFRRPTTIEWFSDVRLHGKDSLENHIVSKTEPSIQCAITTVLNVDDSQFVLLVDIPQSEDPPHMYNGSYCKRAGSRREFMHHYEVPSIAEGVHLCP